MQLHEIAQTLDKKFQINKIKEDWAWMDSRFKPGLMFNFSDKIEKIYTTCFPSEYVLNKIINEKNVLLVSHHPFDWNPAKSEKSFLDWNENTIKKMKQNKISFYFAHLAWDDAGCDGSGLISTTTSFPKAIGMDIERTYLEEGDFQGTDVECGLVGAHKIKDFDKLVSHIDSVTHHKINIIKNNNEKVKKIAYTPGGGNHKEYIERAEDSGINTYITGVTRMITARQKTKMPPFFDYLKENKINLIGCGHYHTEKWAPMYSVEYFKNFAPCEFIEDLPKNELLD